MHKYPIYILSKGRYESGLTAKMFIRDKVQFNLVVEEQEYKEYEKRYGKYCNILVLPFSNLGAIPVRNWIWEHSIKDGFKRHWQFDDNIRKINRLNKGKRINCNTDIALQVVEDYTDRYENIALSGFNYTMFTTDDIQQPLRLNCHVYSAMLIDNNIPFRWRGEYNADTDLCLQVLTNKLCTVQFIIFNVQKVATMLMKDGNTERYQGDGRLKMARSLELMWPKYVETKWRFKRPQHVVNWKKHFKHPLIRRKDIDWNSIPKINNYGLELKQVAKIKSPELIKFYEKNKS